MPLPFDSRNGNIFQRLGAWAILVTSGHAYRYDIVKSRGPQKSTGSPEVERVRQDSHFDRKSITSDNWKGKLLQKHVAWGKIIFSARIKNILSKLTYSDGSVPIDNHRYNIRWPKMVIWGGDRAKSWGWKYYHSWYVCVLTLSIWWVKCRTFLPNDLEPYSPLLGGACFTSFFSRMRTGYMITMTMTMTCQSNRMNGFH